MSPSSRTGARRPGGLRPESRPGGGRGADRPAGVGGGLVDPSGGQSGCGSRLVTTGRGIRFLLFRRAGRARVDAVQQHGGQIRIGLYRPSGASRRLGHASGQPVIDSSSPSRSGQGAPHCPIQQGVVAIGQGTLGSITAGLQNARRSKRSRRFVDEQTSSTLNSMGAGHSSWVRTLCIARLDAPQQFSQSPQ